MTTFHSRLNFWGNGNLITPTSTPHYVVKNNKFSHTFLSKKFCCTRGIHGFNPLLLASWTVNKEYNFTNKLRQTL